MSRPAAWSDALSTDMARTEGQSRATTRMLTRRLACGLLAVAAPVLAQEPRDAVAVIGGETVSDAKLEELAGPRLARVRAEEYAIKRRALDEYIRQALLEKEAQKRHLTVAQLKRAEIEGKTKAVTDEEVQAILEMRPDNAAAQTAEQVRAQLQQQRLRRREAEFRKDLRDRLGVKVLLDPPRVQIAGEGPSRGPASAPVSLVVFSDFQCPYCARLVPTLKQLEDKYGERLRVTFRDFPLSIHKDAAKAAEAGRCATEQGKFWPLHDKLFAGQRSLDVTALKRYAGEAGLDAAAFGKCLDSGKFAAAVQQDMPEGNRLGVSGTPSVFVNGRAMPSGGSLEGITEVVEEELALLARAKR